MHASRLEVYIIVRTKMRLPYAERDTRDMHTSECDVCVCSRTPYTPVYGTHSKKHILRVFLSTPTQTHIRVCKQMNIQPTGDGEDWDSLKIGEVTRSCVCDDEFCCYLPSASRFTDPSRSVLSCFFSAGQSQWCEDRCHRVTAEDTNRFRCSEKSCSLIVEW